MDSKEDEEITFDFGKIKNFFRSGRKEEKKEEQASKEVRKDDDAELSFDFGKAKKFFKFSEEERGTEQEIPINWNKIFDFFRRYGVVFIALIPIILSIYVRLQAGNLPITDNWAGNTVIGNIRAQIRGNIDQQYPNLPDANKNAIVDTELQKVLSQNKRQIDDTIKAYSNSFKAFFQDDNGKIYMPDIDPYYWFRYANNIVEHGHPGDVLKDGKPFDTYQLAPIGRFVYPDMFHAYSLAYFYKLLHFLIPDLGLMRSMFYLPVFVSALCVLLVFLIARRIAGNIGGFFAGMIMAVNGAFLSRSLHPDNDIWVVLFPLLVAWLFVSTMETRSTLKTAAISLIAGFFTGLFTTAWSGWWYIFDFLLATIGLTFLYLVFVNFDELKRNVKSIFLNTALKKILIFGLVYVLSTALFATFFSGFSQFRNSFLGPLSFPSIKAPVQATSLWPNVLTTVAELNEGSIDGIINSIGGRFLFYISLLGLLLAVSRVEGLRKFDLWYTIAAAVFYGSLFTRLGSRPSLYQSMSVITLLILIMLPVLLRVGISVHKKDASYDFNLSILLSLWVASTIFASIKGIRFTLLLAPAFSVAFGVALGKLYIYLSKLLSKEFKIHKAVGNSILIVLLLLMYIAPIRGAINAAGSDLPIINDAWHNALSAIKQSSGKDAIITSWWDFGHHFKALAERRVTFDGTTQTSEAAHWVGKLLMTPSEEQAVGILRMLDCGGNHGFNEVDKIKKNTHESLRILNDIVVLDRIQAERKLKSYGFDGAIIENILQRTHCNPPEAYFIASEDMIGKSGVWSHFGSWNFERADIWQNARKMPQEQAVEYMIKRFNYTKERAENTYFEMQVIENEPDANKRDSEANKWVAPWPGYGGTVNCGKNKDVYICGNGFLVNMTNHDIYAVGQQGIVRPRIAAFTTGEGLFRKEFNGATLDFGMTIIPKNENELEVVLSSKELTGGMFTRMFYMRGHGLRYFKLFNHQRGLTGTDIFVYKVDWEGKNATVVQDYANYLKGHVMEEGLKENVQTESINASTNINIS